MLDTSLLVPVGMIRVNLPQSRHAAVRGGGGTENRGGVKGERLVLTGLPSAVERKQSWIQEQPSGLSEAGTGSFTPDLGVAPAALRLAAG